MGLVNNMETKIEIKHLYKIFGDDPQTMLQKVRDGVTKDDLNDQYNHVLGLSDINLKMPAKGIQVVMGLSGSGKSTLIRHINRLIEPTAGEVWIDGENVLSMDEQTLRDFRRNRASMVFQKFALLPHRTVMENTIYGLAIQGMAEKKAEKHASHWIERVGLAGYEDNYPGQLSGGMQQRVGLARALATDADILLMDEAFSALDPLIRTDMQNILLDLQQELHKTIVFITHDLDEALKLADHLVILKDGYAIQQGEPQDILLNPCDPYIEQFVSDINRARVLRVRSIMKPLQDTIPPGAISVDPDSNLEQVIESVDGDTSKHFVVEQDGEKLGMLSMHEIMIAMVPRRASEELLDA